MSELDAPRLHTILLYGMCSGAGTLMEGLPGYPSAAPSYLCTGPPTISVLL